MKRFLILALAFIALGSLLGLAAQENAQEKRTATPTPIDLPKFCPKPLKETLITLTAPPPVAATPDLQDFPATPCSAGFEPNFGGTTLNRCFRHTFTWKVPEGCKCLSGELVLQYSALQAGPNSGDNDSFAIFSGGSAVPGTSMALYTGTAPVGKVLTKTIPLNCSWLARNKLSFLVQDDTKVISATLRVRYCCSPCPPGQTETTFPGTEIRYCCDGKPGMQHFCCNAQKVPVVGNPPDNLPN